MRPGITAATQADEVAQLMFYEDLKDVVLVGTSYGGMVACRTAELMRERIGRLVFVDALTLFDGEKVADILPRSTSAADGVTPRPSPGGCRKPVNSGNAVLAAPALGGDVPLREAGMPTCIASWRSN